MNRYEQYLKSQAPTPQPFQVGDRVVWRYHNGDPSWLGTVTEINEDGWIMCRGAWSAQQAFSANVGGFGAFHPDRQDGYLEYYREETP